ncbi:MAG: SGNH/GDSL hydrolase family protein [Limnohabitans sp.]|nr:SGNH/GDSL hydrolase family protein [Limnohabitans sp.]
MRNMARLGWGAGLAALVVLGLAGCGGNDNLAPKTAINKIYVMGDSLADVGTFGGIKFTVQDPINPKNSLIWTQLIANNFGLDGSAQCNFYSIGNAVTTNSNCTNFAIGGARIFNKPADTLPTVGDQLTVRSAAPFAETDLLLVDGGGNDAADLATAFLTVAGGGNVADYQAFLSQQLSLVELSNALTQDPSGSLAAGLYMQNLAKTYYKAIKENALDKGAKRIGVLNVPDITVTPRFQAVLVSLGNNGPAIQSLIRQWITAFNTQLKTSIAADSRIALVDFYTDFQDEVNKPADYGLINVTTPVCSVVKSENFGNFPCLSTELDAVPDKTAGWWKNYAFSDGFHPTPYGHSLLAASVSRALARAGWL